MSKKYNLRLIKSRESYSFKEISKLFNMHVRTVQLWRQNGLKVINDSRPFLVMGFELKDYLAKHIKSRKQKLSPNEFYCVKCRKPVTSINNIASLHYTGQTIGSNHYSELIIQGECYYCQSRINRFSHEGQMLEIKQNFQIDKGGNNV